MLEFLFFKYACLYEQSEVLDKLCFSMVRVNRESGRSAIRFGNNVAGSLSLARLRLEDTSLFFLYVLVINSVAAMHWGVRSNCDSRYERPVALLYVRFRRLILRFPLSLTVLPLARSLCLYLSIFLSCQIFAYSVSIETFETREIKEEEL